MTNHHWWFPVPGFSTKLCDVIRPRQVGMSFWYDSFHRCIRVENTGIGVRGFKSTFGKGVPMIHVEFHFCLVSLKLHRVSPPLAYAPMVHSVVAYKLKNKNHSMTMTCKNAGRVSLNVVNRERIMDLQHTWALVKNLGGRVKAKKNFG